MPRDPLNDIDADLRKLLSVDPSPQFEARVRARVSTTNMAGAWWSLRWTLAAAAAVVVAVVSGVLVFRAPSMPASVPAPHAVAAGTAPRELAPQVEQRAPQPGPPDVGAPRRALEARTVRAAVSAREPEVLVDVRQRVAVERLIAMARAGLLKAEEMPVMAPGLADLVVEPLQIPAIGGGELKP